LAVFIGVALAGCGTREEVRPSAKNGATPEVSSTRAADESQTAAHGPNNAGERGAPPCGEKPSGPEQLPDAESGQIMLAEFTKLYETGKFTLGYCLADVQVNTNGTVQTVRVVRPPNIDDRVAAIVTRTLASRRYKPARACGRPVAFTISVGIFHCPFVLEK
jgi:hypothetical protein